MEITQEKIDKLYQLFEELSVINQEASDAINHAKSFGENEIEVVRKDGKKDKISEKLLWDEIYYLGRHSEGYEVLEKKYPVAFKKTEEANKKKEEVNIFSIRELGIDITQIKLSDIIRLVQATVRYELKNSHVETERKT